MAEDKSTDKTTDEPKANALDKRVKDAIKSLRFRTNKRIEVEGEPIRHVPDERPMKLSDVLNAADVDGTLVIVSADGRKHRIAA